MLETLVLRVEHPYIVRKSEKSPDMGELTFHAEKTACCNRKTKYMFTFSMTCYFLKLHK